MKILKNLSLFALLVLALGLIGQEDANAQRVKKGKSKKDKKKKTEEVIEAPVIEKPWATKENPNGCLMYGEDSIKAIQSYSLYRTSFKADNVEEALPHWEYVYNNAPGLREQTYKDGEQMYKGLFEKEADETKKRAYFDKLMEIYDNRAICWGKSDYLTGKKGLAFAKYYPDGNEEKVFDLLEKAIDNGGENTSYTVLQPLFLRAMKRYTAKTINAEELEETYEKIINVAEHNAANNEKKGPKYQSVLDGIAPLYEKVIAAEEAKAFAAADKEERDAVRDCASAKSYYGTKYQADPNDEVTMQKYYRSLRRFRCTSDPDFLNITIKLNERSPSSAKLKYIASSYQAQGNYTEAENYYNQAMSMETDNRKKADIKMKLAYLYTYKVKNTSKGASYAREAADLRPDWGDPWILIGNIYAGKASSCGGFDGRACIWAAMDMWGKAKRVDPASSNKAQESINRFYSSMPDKKTSFGMGLSAGSSYTVKCLGVTTSVRYP